MNAELIFEEPPNPGRGPGGGNASPIAAWLDELRQHPNQWAKYPERVHHNTVTFIRTGRNYGVTAGEFEVTGRDIKYEPTSRCDLFARYIGSES